MLEFPATPAAGCAQHAFIQPVLAGLPAAQPGLRYCLAAYRAELFSERLFDLYGVPFPAEVRNSVVKRRAEFLAGRVCAQTMLASCGVVAPVVGTGAHREPSWPAGFIGSITHNGHYAAAVACRGGRLAGIGIDIESEIGDALSSTAEIVVSPREIAYLDTCPGGLRFETLLTLVFSAKESFFKAAFPQVKAYFDFSALQAVEIDTQARRIRLRCTRTLSASLQAGLEIQAHFAFLDSTTLLTSVCLGR
jgi:enterobactin synthetase component D